MLQKQKCTRTQITDLAEIAVELSDREMRIVSGGISVNMRSCAVNISSSGGTLFAGCTNVATGQDWDCD
jgi:hypothetical protein